MESSSILELQAKCDLLPHLLRVKELSPGYPVIEVTNEFGAATMALHGAHLIDWTPKGNLRVLYTSPEAVYREGKAIRGGIPICWPWFGAHPHDPDKPSHGFARDRFWTLEGVKNDLEKGTELRFSLRASDESRALWPHEFSLHLVVVVGPALRLSLTTNNTGEESITVGGALHTYLRTGTLSGVHIEGLDGTTYVDTVGEWTERTQLGAVTIAQEVDRIYRSGASHHLTDSALSRVIEVAKSGSETSVIWNPWIEKSQALGDLPDDGYQNFVCIETTNALEDVRILAEGEAHCLETIIRLCETEN